MFREGAHGVSPIAFNGKLVRGVRRQLKPYTPKDRGTGLVLGFDTETIQTGDRAQLYTVQISHGPSARHTSLDRCDDSADAWRALVREVRARGHGPDDGPVVVWAFNLNFDLLWLFGSSPQNRRVLAGGSYFGKIRRLDADGAKIGLRSLVYGRVAFAEIDHEGYRWIFRDLSMFWPGTLAGLAQRLGVRKLARPEGLGERRLLGDTPGRQASLDEISAGGGPPGRSEFVRYAKRDAVIAYRAGQLVAETLTRLGVWSFKHVPVSSAHAAALLFRSKLAEPVPAPRTFPQLRAALFGYAGGRAGTRFRGTWPERVRCYDVNSMYPAAMLELPEPGGWSVTTVLDYAGPDGIYLVDGRCDDREYPGLVERDRYGRMWPLVGTFRAVWATGYEIESFRRWGDGELNVRYGFHFHNEAPATTFPAFVSALYELRAESEPPLVRDLAKALLNGLAGKFIEHHSRFSLPAGLRFRVPAPPTGPGYYVEYLGRDVDDPSTGSPHRVMDEYTDAGEARDFDEYIAGVIDAVISGDYEEVKRRASKVAEGKRVAEVNLEYLQQDAGGTFAPELATLILGRARARLHDLMHEHRAIYWDTDSIVTEAEVATGTGVGELKLEAEGTITVSRPKVYVIEDGAAVVRIAAAGYPERLATETKVGIVKGELREYTDARTVSPRTTRDPLFRDVGTFWPTRVRIEPTADDDRNDWRGDGDFQLAEPRPMPYKVRGLGRLRYAT